MIARPPLPLMFPRRCRAAAFTLLEILLASMAAAVVLAALYGIFMHAIKLRDSATDRVRQARLRARAEAVIRTDLQSALISGGIIASSLEGGTNDNSGPGGGSLPGYLKLTTTTGRDNGTDLYGDVQQVEYYLEKDPDAPPGADSKGANVLVRALTRDLLSTSPAVAREEQVLHGVQSLTVEFYDGATWQQTWSYDSSAALNSSGNDASTSTTISLGNTTLPDAVRVGVQQGATTPNGHLPPPVEVLVPWTTQAFAAATPSAATSTAAATASPSPSALPTPPTGPGRGGPGGGPGGPGGGGPGGGGPGGGQPPSGPPPSGPPSGGGGRSPR